MSENSHWYNIIYIIMKSRCSRLIGLIIVLTALMSAVVGIDFEGLSSIGVVKGRTLNYKIRGNSAYKILVIKLTPTIRSTSGAVNFENCTKDQISAHKVLVRNVLTPVKDALTSMKSKVTDYTPNSRLFGAIVAGAALVTATAATITAGVALHQSNQNAQAIANMKDAISKTNQAVSELKQGTQKLATVVDSLQNQINSQIIPVLNQLGCQTTGLTIGLYLTRYYSEILTVFGPAIQDPVNSALTIQAISKAFEGNFDKLMSAMGYSVSDLKDVLESDLVRGKIIDVDPDVGYMALQIEFPQITPVTGAHIQELLPISFNYKGDEWITILPSFVLNRMTYLSNIDIAHCLVTETSVICDNDLAMPMSTQMRDCLLGNTSKCSREQVITSYVPRFALSGGVIYANCLNTQCACATNGRSISQSSRQTIMMLDDKDCKIYEVGGIFISVSTYMGIGKFENENISIGPPVVVDKIDVSGQLAEVNQSLSKTEELLEESNEYLSQVHVSLVSLKSMIILYVFIGLIGLLAAAALLVSVRSLSMLKTMGPATLMNNIQPTMHNLQYSGHSTINSKSSLINTHQSSHNHKYGSVNGSYTSDES
ncbi:fusion protein [Ninorex virus]|nr:fusion protein [Ninorex virus]